MGVLVRRRPPVPVGAGAGAGAGSFRFAWTERRPVDISAQNAHSLYLETLGDTGLVGLLFLVLPPAAVLAAVARRRRVGRNRVRHEAAAIVAAGGALAAHLAVDWDGSFPPSSCRCSCSAERCFARPRRRRRLSRTRDGPPA